MMRDECWRGTSTILMFIFETLEFLLRKYGFSRVVKQAYDRSILEELRIDQERRQSESLHIEAVK